MSSFDFAFRISFTKKRGWTSMIAKVVVFSPRATEIAFASRSFLMSIVLREEDAIVLRPFLLCFVRAVVLVYTSHPS